MLEEEKNSSNDELIDIISCKESIDNIIKIIITKLLNNKNGLKQNDKDNNLNEEEIDKPFDILIDELLSINSEKTSWRICEELYDIYELDKKNNNYINRSYIPENKNKNKQVLNSHLKHLGNLNLDN